MNEFHFRVELTDRGNGRQWYAFAERDAAQRFMDGMEVEHRKQFPEHDLQLFAERVDAPMPTPRHGVYRSETAGQYNFSFRNRFQNFQENG